MALSTPLTRLLGIAHPVLLAPMALVSGGRLAAAVSEAGGLGLIGGGYGDAGWLAREIAAAGNARVGVGFITWSLAQNPALLTRVLAHRPAAIMFSFGDERPFVAAAKDAGAKVIVQVQSVAQATTAAANGADVIVAQGTEAGGHGALRATLPLVPAVVDAVHPLPVVAAGGIADGRGLAAMLTLGAAGVLLGTRFYAAQESLAAEAAKRLLAEASGDRTARGSAVDIVRGIEWPVPYTLRTLRNDFVDRWQGREAALRQVAAAEARRYSAAQQTGDFATAAVIAGEAADLIRDVPAAGEIVRRIAAEAERLVQGGALEDLGG